MRTEAEIKTDIAVILGMVRDDIKRISELRDEMAAAGYVSDIPRAGDDNCTCELCMKTRDVLIRFILASDSNPSLAFTASCRFIAERELLAEKLGAAIVSGKVEESRTH